MKDIDVVVNFDFPKTIDDYIHRIGRTGRAGREGLALTLVNASDDRKLLKALIKVMRESNQVVPAHLDKLANTFANSQLRKVKR